MELKDIKKDWDKWLIDIEKSETQVAKEQGMLQSNLNRKLKTGTIKYFELINILEKYEYTLKITKIE